MKNFEKDYVALIGYISERGCVKSTRNARTKSLFGVQFYFDDLNYSTLPILQGRKIYTSGVIGELAAMLKGPKTVQDFKDQGCNYWDAWRDDEGKLNVDYGNLWLDFNGVNQLEAVVNSLKNDPSSRRHLISGWKPDNVADLSLPCCHYSYQWYVTDDGHLDMVWVQRSVDVMVGLPSDILLAAVFNILMAQTVGLTPGTVTMQFGDTHIYESHKPGVAAYLEQAKVLDLNLSEPQWNLAKEATVFNFVPSMLEIVNYSHAPAINFKLEV